MKAKEVIWIIVTSIFWISIATILGFSIGYIIVSRIVVR